MEEQRKKGRKEEGRTKASKEEGRKKASKALLKEGWKEEGGKKR